MNWLVKIILSNHILRSSEALKLMEYMLMFYEAAPCDWLLSFYLKVITVYNTIFFFVSW